MTYAPQSIRDAAAWISAKGFVVAGIVGDAAHQARASYHNGRDVIEAHGRTCATDYTICHPRDVAGLSHAASALDIKHPDAERLRAFTRRLGELVIAGHPATRDIRDVIGSPDGQTVLCWLSPELSGGKGEVRAGCADASHLWHTHISWFRDSEARDKIAAFRAALEDEMFPVVTVRPFPSIVTWRVKAGTTLRGYDPARPNTVVKEIRFDRDSMAHADARVGVSWQGVPAGGSSPIPRGYPFLRVVNGAFDGLLIVEAQVALDPVPDPAALARGKALEEARNAAIDAVGKAIDALPR